MYALWIRRLEQMQETQARATERISKGCQLIRLESGLHAKDCLACLASAGCMPVLSSQCGCFDQERTFVYPYEVEQARTDEEIR